MTSGRLLLSQAFEDLLGTSLSNLESLYDHLEPASATRLRNWLSELALDYESGEVPLSFKNRHPTAYIAQLEPLFYKGELKGVQGRMFPILSMLHEQMLPDKEPQTSAQGNLGIVLTDPLGLIDDCNPLFCKMLGMSRTALLGSRLQNFIHPADRTQPIALYHQLRDGKLETLHLEKRYRQADGTYFHAEVGIALVRSEQGDVSHCIRFILNLSARQQLEAEHQLQKNLIDDLEL